MLNQDRGITKFGPKRLLNFSLLLVAFLLPLEFFAGCRNCEHVETALRMREQDLLHMRQELLSLEFRNQALQHQLQSTHHLPPPHYVQIAPDSGSAALVLEKITLGRTTGGFNDDKNPGENALQVVIEPRDRTGEIVKAPGSARVTALEISPDGLKKPIGAWQIAEGQVDRSWKRALFANGYVIVLPWQTKPKSHQLRVVVRFRLTGGKEFEAEKDVRLRPSARMPRTGEGPPIPAAPLHPPRKIQPADQGIITPLSSFSLFRWLKRKTSDGGKKVNKVTTTSRIETFIAPTSQATPSSQWRAPEEQRSIRLLRPVPID